MKIYFIVILYLFITQASSLSCYTCIESVNIETCELKQKSEDCSSNNLAVCMALSFSTFKDQQESTRYVKKCMKKSVCEGYCKLPGVSDVLKKCQTKCCESDGCNKHMFQYKFKRSPTTGSVNNSHGKVETTFLFMIGNLIILFFLIKLNVRTG